MKNKKNGGLNHQKTVQEAYGNIHKVLGNKNFKKMTADTNQLLAQQNKLTESLNNMAPILKSAESMLNKFDMEQMTGMLDLPQCWRWSRQKRKTKQYIDMPKRCPPGVFCIENYTIFAIFCILIVALAYIFVRKPTTASPSEKVDVNIIDTVRSPFVRANPRLSYNEQDGDILLNPYAPPVNDERYLIPSQDVRGRVPINIRTQGVDADTAK